MSTSNERPGEAVRDVRFSANRLIVELVDGRAISAPLEWFPRLLHGSSEQRANWRVIGGGYGIHWPDLDEDLSTDGLLRGTLAPGGSRQA